MSSAVTRRARLDFEKALPHLGEHPGRTPRRGLLDDTLDAHPPYHLYSGKPSPEAIAAARRLMEERGVTPDAPDAASKFSTGRSPRK